MPYQSTATQCYGVRYFRGLDWKFIFAVLILKTPGGLAVFKFLGDVVSRFLEFSDAGAKFVFGEKFEENFFAFKVLPTIIFFSAFISVLYHYGILQRVVKRLAWVMMKTMEHQVLSLYPLLAISFWDQLRHRCWLSLMWRR